jgi:predicted heme/steroid binding protein
LIKTDADNADLYIGYQVAVDQQKQWKAWGTGRGFGGGMGQATSSTIDTGTLALDMYDPSSKQLVWQGRATKTLEPSGNQQKNEKNLNKAIAKLLKNFPPKA